MFASFEAISVAQDVPVVGEQLNPSVVERCDVAPVDLGCVDLTVGFALCLLLYPRALKRHFAVTDDARREQPEAVGVALHAVEHRLPKTASRVLAAVSSTALAAPS